MEDSFSQRQRGRPLIRIDYVQHALAAYFVTVKLLATYFRSSQSTRGPFRYRPNHVSSFHRVVEQ